MKIFVLRRTEDASGVSGIGDVADGAIFPDGTVVMKWRGDLSSIAIYPSLSVLENIHGHQGRTKVVLL